LRPSLRTHNLGNLLKLVSDLIAKTSTGLSQTSFRTSLHFLGTGSNSIYKTLLHTCTVSVQNTKLCFQRCFDVTDLACAS
jgi:hypothetical protein